MLKLLRLLFFFIILLFWSCAEETSKTFHLTGEIKNLTKGTVYLEKIREGRTILVDSFAVRDNGKFEFTSHLSSPEVYSIKLKDYPGDKVMLFAEPGEMEFNTHIERFIRSAEVKGSKNHELWDNFKLIMGRFNDENLLLIQKRFLAEKEKDSVRLDSIYHKFKQLQRRRYLYATNFAVNHADKEISPYIALTELSDANAYLLDTIYQSMTNEVKKSHYGKIFRRYYTKSDKNVKE